MADAIISVVVKKIAALVEEQIQNEVNLVKGAEKEVLKLSRELETIKCVLADAESRRFKDKLINYWLTRLEQASRDMVDVLDEWDYAILKLKMKYVVARPKHKVWSFVPSSSLSYFKKVVVSRDIAKKIINVKEKLDEILKEKDRYNFVVYQPTLNSSLKSWRDPSISFIDLAEVHGRDFDRDTLLAKLMGNDEGLGYIQVVSIVGVGGLGKTTLAQLIYNDSRVETHFDLRIWVCVSDPFDLAVIAKGIIESVRKGVSPSTDNLETLLECVRDSISGKKILLVLDDVWIEEYGKWERLENYLKCGKEGSKILVTTRKQKVAKIMGTMDRNIHYLGQLPVEHCWVLLGRIALLGRDELEFKNTDMKIAKKCNGLPLAVKTLGGVLRHKSTLEEWEDVMNSDIWDMKEAEVELFPHLLLSYNELSSALKCCFSYCAIIPKDSKIIVDILINHWMALGCLGSDSNDMEDRGREFFDILAMHSLFQDFEKDNLDGKIKKCQMHDIVHGFSQFLKKTSWVEVTRTSTSTTCRACDPSIVSVVHELYCLFWDYKNSPPNICDCLTRLRVLSLQNCLSRIPHRMGKLIHLRWLNLNGSDISRKDLKIIFQLYNLQTLNLEHCSLELIPKEIGNLIHLRNLNLCRNESLKELPREIENLIHLRHFDLYENESLEKLPSEIGNLIHLRHLDLHKNESLKELPIEIGNLIHLRHLDLRWNKSLNELPREIGNLVNLRNLNLEGTLLENLPREIVNLIQLKHLNLSWNKSLKELPKEIGNLIHLRSLNLKYNESLKEVPESIYGLHELQTLNIKNCESLCVLPERLARLTSLRSLKGFEWGSGGSKLGLLKNLNHLTGLLRLLITLVGDDFEKVVEDIREAELRNKIHMEELEITFEQDFSSSTDMDEEEKESSSTGKDEMENESSSIGMVDVIDALEPQPNLRELKIWGYTGSSLSLGWIISPLNQVRKVNLYDCNRLTSLPSFGKLPCLEKIKIGDIYGLEILGREFLGITSVGGTGEEFMNIQSSSSEINVIVFPKLKSLKILNCGNWKEWEDITPEEEESEALSIMPRLTELHLSYCNALTALPHRLLRKASSLEIISVLMELHQRYEDEDGHNWKYISRNNPRLQLH